MGKGLTGGVLLGGIALVLYLFTKQGKAAGDRGIGYLQGHLDSLGGEDENEDNTKAPTGGDSGEEPEDEVPLREALAQADPGPPVDTDTGAAPNAQRQVQIVDDEPEAPTRAPSRADVPIFLQGHVFEGLGGRGPAQAPLNVKALDLLPDAAERSAAVARFGVTSPTSVAADRRQESGATGKEIIAAFQKRAVIPNRKATATAPSPASQARPEVKAPPVQSNAKSLNARVAAAEAEGRRQGAANPVRSRAPRKAGLYQTREEILAKVRGFEAGAGRGAV